MDALHRLNPRRLVAIAGIAAIAVALLAIQQRYRPAAARAVDTPASGAPARATQPAEARSIVQLIGLERAAQLFGDRLPTGKGIRAAHVEGADDYLPARNADVFKRITLNARSGEAKTGGHADATARIIYGTGGLAPGIDTVDCYHATHFLNAGVLNTNRPAAPDAYNSRLFSHSWISEADTAFARDALRRADELIDRAGVVMCVGVNNGKSTKVPAVLASAYNVIAVGQYDGNSSGGYTLAEGEGRCSPHVVAPGSVTSNSTPVVTAIVARLMEAADRLGDKSPARRPEVIKAVLLAGAEKPDTWKPAPGKPLDEHLGAGRARIDAALEILLANAGELPAPHVTPLPSPIPVPAATQASPLAPVATQPTSAATPGVDSMPVHSGRASFPSTATAASAASQASSPTPQASTSALAPLGWTYRTIAHDQHDYTLHLDKPASVSIVLYWHRRVDGGVVNDPILRRARWNNTPRLATMDLAFTPLTADASSTPVPSGRASAPASTDTNTPASTAPPLPIATSAARGDNVQHIYLPRLDAGDYRITIARRDALAEAWTYALAWRCEAR